MERPVNNNQELIFPIDKGRMEQVMEAYDQLPPKLRQFIQDLDFSIHDKHIVLGPREIARVKIYLQHGGQVTYEPGNGQN